MPRERDDKGVRVKCNVFTGMRESSYIQRKESRESDVIQRAILSNVPQVKKSKVQMMKHMRA